MFNDHSLGSDHYKTFNTGVVKCKSNPFVYGSDIVIYKIDKRIKLSVLIRIILFYIEINKITNPVFIHCLFCRTVSEQKLYKNYYFTEIFSKWESTRYTIDTDENILYEAFIFNYGKHDVYNGIQSIKIDNASKRMPDNVLVNCDYLKKHYPSSILPKDLFY